ncbi:endosome-associated-trafficking regulator 1 [Carettochelys insculpta]|uniref:endosome-associated-trafficking regulator 1 n=1 Tax=Carettochelys insculpta TaxID=44489 RepID=UPI003EBE51DB
MAGRSRTPQSPSPILHSWGGESRARRGVPAGSPPTPPASLPGDGEGNPFSFREFVRSQARSAAPAAASPQAAAAPSPEPFFPDLTAGASPLDDDEEEEAAAAEWSGCYQPSAVERALSAGRRLNAWGGLDSSAAAAAWSDPEESALWELEESEPPPAGGDGPSNSRQPSAAELQEENARLRSKINQLLLLSETQADKVRKLERKLEENKIKEQKEAWDLEAMVQHVEQNLQLMTKRAVKAENNVSKLKQENALLQVQLKNYKTENEALKTGQSASLAVVKQNADLALQNLLSVITNSRSSIKQLVSGAESLQVVAELLKSIDRISEISDDGL